MSTRTLPQPSTHPGASARPEAAESSGRRRRTAARTAPVLAAAAAVLAWLPLHALADLEVRQGGGSRPVDAAAVVVSALVAGLGALGVAALAGRRTRRPRRAFLGTALAVLVVSLLGPLGAATGPGAALALTGLHLVVAAVVVPLVARSLPHAR